MRGHFSIEWLAQSSQPAVAAATDPAACGTHSECLPGFYSRRKSETVPEKQEDIYRHNAQQLQNSNSTPGMFTDYFTCFGLQPPLISKSPVFMLESAGFHPPPLPPAVSEAGFSSGTEEETSGYESESERSLSPVTSADCASASPPSPPSGRRPRTAFTADQISSLERAFKRNAYLGTQDKAELCKKLNLSDKQVRTFILFSTHSSLFS